MRRETTASGSSGRCSWSPTPSSRSSACTVNAKFSPAGNRVERTTSTALRRPSEPGGDGWAERPDAGAAIGRPARSRRERDPGSRGRSSCRPRASSRGPARTPAGRTTRSNQRVAEKRRSRDGRDPAASRDAPAPRRPSSPAQRPPRGDRTRPTRPCPARRGAAGKVAAQVGGPEDQRDLQASGTPERGARVGGPGARSSSAACAHPAIVQARRSPSAGDAPAVAKMLFRLPRRGRQSTTPSQTNPRSSKRRRCRTRAGRGSATSTSQTAVVSRSKRSTFIVTDEPDGQNQAITREEGERWAEAQDEYIAEQDMVVIDGYIGNNPEFRTPGAPLRRGGEREHRRHAAAALLRAGRGRRARAGADRDLHAEPEGRGLPGRPPDRRRPRAGRDARLQLRLLRRVEEGRAADVEQARLRPRRAPAARRLQDHPDPPRQARRPDRRPLRHGQDDDHLHAPERLAAGPGRLRRLDAGRPRLRDRERLLRQDLRAQPRGRADDLRRGHAARLVPRERLAARRRGRLLRHELHLQRPRHVPVPRDRSRLGRRDRGGALPPDPEQEREHRPRRREARRAAGSGLLHARRDHRHERRRRRRGRQVPARARDEPVLPDAARPPGQPLPRAARRAPARGLPAEHRPSRGRPRGATSAR